MKYLIYARISPRGSDFDRETSIPMQIDLCKEYVQSQHGEVVKVLTDEFLSGKDTNRPGMQQLLAELESGQAEWDCVCVYKLSRITRSLRDGADIFDKFIRWNKGFVSITEKNLDFSTPNGRAMLGILQVFNQFEREQTAENTVNRMISIAAKGEWPVGKPPFGYRRGAKHDNVLYVDPRLAESVRDIFESYAGDVPLWEISKKYAKPPQSILYILRNKLYLGQIVYAGKTFAGKHDPIITPELFASVQNKLPKAKPDGLYTDRVKKQRYPYILSGLVKCHCGRYMTPASVPASYLLSIH